MGYLNRKRNIIIYSEFILLINQEFEDEVFCMKFSPNKKLIAVGSYDTTIKLFDSNSLIVQKTLIVNSLLKIF